MEQHKPIATRNGFAFRRIGNECFAVYKERSPDLPQ